MRLRRLRSLTGRRLRHALETRYLAPRRGMLDALGRHQRAQLAQLLLRALTAAVRSLGVLQHLL